MTVSRWQNILQNKTPPPDGEQLALRCDHRGEEVYLRIRTKGWFYYDDGMWKHCPLGHPTATFPRDFVDPPEQEEHP